MSEPSAYSASELAHQAGLDQVRFWRLQCNDQDLVGELYQQLREGETCFVRVAEQAVDTLARVVRPQRGRPLSVPMAACRLPTGVVPRRHSWLEAGSRGVAMRADRQSSQAIRPIWSVLESAEFACGSR